MNPQNMPLQPPSSLAIERQLGVFVFHLRNDRDERRDGRPGDAPGRSTGLRITLEAMKNEGVSSRCSRRTSEFDGLTKNIKMSQ